MGFRATTHCFVRPLKYQCQDVGVEESAAQGCSGLGSERESASFQPCYSQVPVHANICSVVRCQLEGLLLYSIIMPLLSRVPKLQCFKGSGLVFKVEVSSYRFSIHFTIGRFTQVLSRWCCVVSCKCMYCVCTYTWVYRIMCTCVCVCMLHVWRLKTDMQYPPWLPSALSFHLELNDWAGLVE